VEGRDYGKSGRLGTRAPPGKKARCWRARRRGRRRVGGGLAAGGRRRAGL